MRFFELINKLRSNKNDIYSKAERVISLFFDGREDFRISIPVESMERLKQLDSGIHDLVVSIDGAPAKRGRDEDGSPFVAEGPKGGLKEISDVYFKIKSNAVEEANLPEKLERMDVLLKQLEKDLDALNNKLLEYRKNNLDYLLNRDEIQLQQFLTDLRNLRSAIKGRDRGNVGYKDFGILRKPASLKPFHLERPLNPEEIKEHLQDTCSIYVYSQTGSRKLELYSDQETGLSLGEITNEQFDLALKDYMSKGNKVEIKSNTAKGTVYRFASPMAKQLFLRSLATKVMPEKQRQNAQQAQQLAEQLGGNLPGAMGQGPRILPPGFDPDNLPGAVRPGRGP